MKTHRHTTPSRSFIANQPSPKFGAIPGVKELKSKYQGTSWNKDMVKIEEYDDANIILETSFKYSALEEQVKESSGSLGGLFSFDSFTCSSKAYSFSTTKGKRSYTSLTSDAGFYYEDKNNEGENRRDLPGIPVYTTTRSGPGYSPVFSSVVELYGVSFSGDPAKKKKKAEKNAARAGWVSIKQNLGSTHHQQSQQQTTERDSTL